MITTGQTINNLAIANNESVVQQSIIGFFQSKGNLLFNRFRGDDGVLYDESDGNKKGYISILFEFKHDENLSNNKSLARALVQSLVYLYRMDNSTQLKTPKVVAIVDKNEFVYFHTNQLVGYLAEEVAWPNNASNSWKEIPSLYNLVLSDLDNQVLIPIYHTISGTNLPIIYKGILNYCKNNVQKRPVTSNKIKKAFSYWEEDVLLTKISPNDSVNLFVHLFVNPLCNGLNNKKTDGSLITESFGNSKIKVNKTKFELLMGGFDVTNFSNREKKKITSTQDTLIQDAERRRLGAFYTQSVWAETADLYYESVFPNYKNSTDLVWDSSAGTGNLTKDRRYSNLILSTKERADVDTILQSGYNNGAIVAEIDNLEINYDLLPIEIKNSIENCTVIHKLENPPYATSANMGKTSKSGVSDTRVKKLMLKDGLGNACDQLFNQFLYQNNALYLETNKKVHIGYFMIPIYFTGEKTKELREFMGKNYKFRKGFLFNAKEFAGVKSWPLIFAIFECGTSEDSNTFDFDILEREGVDVVKKGVKTFYNTDNLESSKDWIKSKWVNKKDNVTFVPTTNGYDVPVKSRKNKSTVKPNFIGFLHNNANSVQFNSQYVGLYTMPFASAHGVSFNEEGFWEAIMMFNARKLIKNTWLNHKDEYLKPNENHPNYNLFKKLSLVRCLFSEGSNQTSWISKIYGGINYRVKNEFFPFTKKHISQYMENHPVMSLYDDFNISEDRFVAKILSDETFYQGLPVIAKQIIEEYKRSYLETIMNSTEYPWDMGYSQFKKITDKSNIELIEDLVKILDEQMKPMVYELGFLLN
jgi:hypothetical protein